MSRTDLLTASKGLLYQLKGLYRKTLLVLRMEGHTAQSIRDNVLLPWNICGENPSLANIAEIVDLSLQAVQMGMFPVCHIG
jgi:hypothetical protein